MIYISAVIVSINLQHPSYHFGLIPSFHSLTPLKLALAKQRAEHDHFARLPWLQDALAVSIFESIVRVDGVIVPWMRPMEGVLFPQFSAWLNECLEICDIPSHLTTL